MYLTRGKKKIALLLPYVENRRMVLSFATVAELRRGAFARGYNEDSWRRMEGDIAAAAVVAPDDALSREWAQLTDQAKKM